VSELTLSICVCTLNRPRELERCLDSIAAGSQLPDEVIVSDDSDSSIARENEALCGRYAFCRYLRGPQHGLCANRNHVIACAKGLWISLLDDDATVTLQFIEEAHSYIKRTPPLTILTGRVLEGGVRPKVPVNCTFLGHFGLPARNGRPLLNINLNCNLFPQGAFASEQFDERLRYGYEDTDLCARLIAKGYAIRYADTLVTSHLPPARTHENTRALSVRAEEARFIVTWRRYARYSPNRKSAAIFAIIAPLHYALSAARQGRLSDCGRGFRWLYALLRGTV
jgi:GT2 family glycosyltransferase